MAVRVTVRVMVMVMVRVRVRVTVRVRVMVRVMVRVRVRVRVRVMVRVTVRVMVTVMVRVMKFQKHAHSDLIAHLTTLNDQLGVARNAFLAKSASKDHFFANLIREAPGKSVAERRIIAESKSAWLEFCQELAHLESVYEFLKLKFKIMEKEYQSSYQETGLNEGLIRKGD